eukprot:GSMAST32.ASY1.ANO1.439.1 assembled CDS
MTMSDQASVRVAVRVRPLLEHELTEGAQLCFTFDHVLLPETSTQATVFDQCVKPILAGCFDGFNATVFAYGQTGSGKTHTMGTSFESSVIPRVMEYLYSRAAEENAKQDESSPPLITMTCSYLELYRDEVRDLLKSTGDSLALREDATGTVFVAGLHEEKVATLQDMAACLRQGATARATGGTKMNAQSSRSHSVFNITIEYTGYRRSTLRLGKRLHEGIAINSGLLALGNVISVLGDEKKRQSVHVYSKLTRLLQSSLGGNSRTLMIACISPADSNFDETINCLRYANRARNIQNKTVQNCDAESAEVMRLRTQVQTLQRLLVKTRARNKEGITGSSTSDESDYHLLQNNGTFKTNKTAAQIDEMQAELELLRWKLSFCSDRGDFNGPDSIGQMKSNEGNGECEDIIYDENEESENAREERRKANELHEKEQKTIAEHNTSKGKQTLDNKTKKTAEEKRTRAALVASMKSLQKDVSTLTEQKKKLHEKLTKLSDKQEVKQKQLRCRYKQQLAALEKKLTTVKNKAETQQKLLRRKEKEAASALKSREQIEALKRQRVQLIRKQKEIARRHREESKARETRLKQLQKQGREQSHKVAKLERQQSKNTAALRQKTAEAAATRKRLRKVHEMQVNAKQARQRQANTKRKINISGPNGVQEHLSKMLSAEVAGKQLRPRLNAATERRKEISLQIASAQGALQRAELSLGKRRIELSKARDLTNANKDNKKATERLQKLRDAKEGLQIKITSLQSQILELDDRKSNAMLSSRWGPVSRTVRHTQQALKFLFQTAVSAQVNAVSADLEEASRVRAVERERRKLERAKLILQRKMRNIYKIRQKRKRGHKRKTSDLENIDKDDKTNQSKRRQSNDTIPSKRPRLSSKSTGSLGRANRVTVRNRSSDQKEKRNSFSELEDDSGSDMDWSEIEGDVSEYDPETGDDACDDDSDFDGGKVRRRRRGSAGTRSSHGAYGSTANVTDDFSSSSDVDIDTSLDLASRLKRKGLSNFHSSLGTSSLSDNNQTRNHVAIPSTKDGNGINEWIQNLKRLSDGSIDKSDKSVTCTFS